MSEELVQKCSTHNDKEIKGFYGEYRWLSNFHLCPLQFEGDTYPSSENAFQAAKACWADRGSFFKCSPAEARKLGQKVQLDIVQWDERKYNVMKRVLKEKFKNQELAQKLKDTKGKYLEETNWWDETIWGVCNGKGQNLLGHLLMTIRDELLYKDTLVTDRTNVGI